MKSAWLLAAMLVCAGACAQDAVTTALHHAAAQADALQTSLPSFSCTVSGTSDVLHKGKLKHSDTFEGTVRAQRYPSGKLVETNTFTTINGAAPKPRQPLPYFVHGGFSEVLTYVSRPLQQCSSFHVEQNAIHFDALPDDKLPVGCGRYRGMSGSFTLDGDGNVTHIERTLPESDDRNALVPSAAIDLAPVQLGGKTYWLASHVVAENKIEDTTLRFEARYSECRLFTVDVKILPGTSSSKVDSSNP